MARWLAIINPCSGQFKSSGFEKRWLPELRKLADEVVFTDSAGAATRIAGEAHDFDGIAVVGGDGTILEVIDGMQRERQHLAAIPTGRGNCLARDLGLKTIADGLTALQSGSETCIDLMQAGIHLDDGSQKNILSASTIALGYVVSVVERASRFRAAGAYGYALSTLLTFPRSFSCRLGIEDRDPGSRRCTGIIINNTVNLANFPTFKDAQLQDGRVDVLILSVGGLRQTLHNLSILSGLGFYEAGDRSQSGKVTVSLDSPQTLLVDGQLLSNVVSVCVECVPAALRCRGIDPT